MGGESQVYRRLDSQWNATCKLLLGKEVGGISGYVDWLLEGIEQMQTRASKISGKEVCAVGMYEKNAPFMSFNEIDYEKKFPPLSVNEVKDIDSIVEALSGRAVYAGNIFLGNSSHVEQSTGIENCHHVLGSHTMHNSQDVAYCGQGRENKVIFGSAMIGESSFIIKGHNNWRSTRCLQTSRAYESSDIFYSHEMRGCSQCMFCFGLKAKRYHIGNLPLPSSKYAQVKDKLLAELAEELMENKRLPWITEFVPREQSRTFPEFDAPPEESSDMGAIRALFSKTTGVVLGKPLTDIDGLGSYLSKHIKAIEKSVSAVSDREVYSEEVRFSREMVKTGRAVKYFELEGITGMGVPGRDVEVDGLSLSSIPDFIGPIAYFTPEERYQSKNAIECSTIHCSHDCFRCSRAYFSEHSCYSFWSRDAKYTLGCDSTRNSSFCINCYNSFKLSRCFETDTSQNCTGCYFCHNCENVHDSMFCFNVKNKRYAIGNVEVGRETFLEAKKRILNQIVRELENRKDFKWSIYNIAKP
ncbi:MAG: hypothetical protein ABIG39_00690 [Candidatus Micrarchaeota archaeon]